MAETLTIPVTDPQKNAIGTLRVEKAGALTPAGGHRFRYTIQASDAQGVPVGVISDNRITTFINWNGSRFMYANGSLNLRQAQTLATQLLISPEGSPLEIANQFYLSHQLGAAISR